MKEWSRFRVGELDGGDACREFSRVSHTSHVDSALTILRDDEIRAGLVFDKSILVDQRVLVSWTSPNHWAPGFRYGNIRFEFDFADLIEGKHFYWVESIPYNTTACRILVTDRDHGKLERYDPSERLGPWWQDGDGKHYYNDRYCLEFMCESTISLSLVRMIDFVKHHSDMCSIHPKKPGSCKEIGLGETAGGSLLLAGAITRNIVDGRRRHLRGCA